MSTTKSDDAMTKHSSVFNRLSRFISHEMRMAHVYQPVMLREILRRKGTATVNEIARALLAEDRSQVEYYEQITKNMVGRVLTKNREITEKENESYKLKGFPDLANQEVDSLITLCDAKIAEYLDKRSDPWSHRRKSTGYIPGTLRYEILKRAHVRCELCGVSADLKAIEVDHIIPRNKGGTDDISNLQALCYSCNATKRDRDDTDFREVAAAFKRREANCPFCRIDAKRIMAENELSFAIRDAYPVSDKHTLIIPKRHVVDFFDLYQPEINAVQSLLLEIKDEISDTDSTVTGFNVGVNVGPSAGQSVFHVHVHLIPRRDGDVPQPRGGVRGVIPGKQNY
jgi:diadenosine tetraphosphate (Ap4A) HIT family hydrolase/5-methylcytosine-specific restriction endonuclease McrA